MPVSHAFKNFSYALHLSNLIQYFTVNFAVTIIFIIVIG
jgi:hypothetical protein